MAEYRLGIGCVALSLDFENEREARRVEKYFDRASSPLEASLSLKIRFRDDAGLRTEVPSSLFLTKTGDGNGFSAGGGLIEGRYSPQSGEGELVVQRLITRGGYARVFEQIFYQAYRSAAARAGRPSFLLHSSGAVRAGRGWVFTGKSGSGKSTAAALSRRKAAVLNDEVTEIDLSPPAKVRGTPFNGFFRAKAEGEAPLAGILLLKQAEEHRLLRTRDAERIRTLALEVIPPMGLETPYSPALFMEMLALAERAAAAVPLYQMEFRRDSGFWDLIDETAEG